MTNKVAKLQRACLVDPVKVEVATKYSTVDTLRQQYLFIPAKYKVRTGSQLPCSFSLLLCLASESFFRFICKAFDKASYKSKTLT